MESEPRRPLPPWAKSLVVTGAVLLVGLPLILWLRRSADQAWASMQDRTRAMFEEAKSRSGARPVLSGTAEPGNAWTDYTAALDDIESIKSDASKLSLFVYRQKGADPAAARALVDSKPLALEHLRRGAHRAEGNFAYEWNEGLRRRQIRPTCGTLSTLALARARFLQEEGRHRDAADLVLDVLQFGSDLRRNSMMLGDSYGASIVSGGLDELKDIVLARKLTAKELSELDRSLDLLDAHWPDFAVSLRNESMLVRTILASEDPESIVGKDISPLKAWRYGFSVKRMAADAARQIEAFVDRSIRHQALPWKERVVAQSQLQREILSTKYIFVMLGQTGVSVYHVEHVARVKLRLVRAMVHYLATGRFATLGDPYGDTLKHAVYGDKVRIWSVGRDGDDHQGKGSWKPELTPLDVVLELPK